MTPVDKNGVPLEVGQDVRIKIRNTVYSAVVMNIYPERKSPFQDGCAVFVEIEGDPETVWSHRLEVVQ